jgi:hypothetical protein
MTQDEGQFCRSIYDLIPQLVKMINNTNKDRLERSTKFCQENSSVILSDTLTGTMRGTVSDIKN